MSGPSGHWKASTIGGELSRHSSPPDSPWKNLSLHWHPRKATETDSSCLRLDLMSHLCMCWKCHPTQCCCLGAGGGLQFFSWFKPKSSIWVEQKESILLVWWGWWSEVTQLPELVKLVEPRGEWQVMSSDMEQRQHNCLRSCTGVCVGLHSPRGVLDLWITGHSVTWMILEIVLLRLQCPLKISCPHANYIL